ERGCDLLRGDLARTVNPITRNGLDASLERFDEHAALARALRRKRHLCERLVDQESRGHEARCARGLDPSELAVKLLRVRLQSCEIGLRVCGVLDAMLDVEICANVLNDDVRRVAPATDGHIAVGEGEPLERCRIRAANNLDARASRMGEPRRVDGADLLEVCTNLVGDLLLALSRAIGQLRSEDGPR